jgi:hypothetical protein
MAALDAGSTAGALIPGLVLVGVGTGLVSPGIAGAAPAAVPQERAGMAGGAVNTFQQLGYALGIALYGTVLTSRMGDTLPQKAAHALVGGGAGALWSVFGEETLRAPPSPTDRIRSRWWRTRRAWWPGFWCSPWSGGSPRCRPE